MQATTNNRQGRLYAVEMDRVDNYINSSSLIAAQILKPRDFDDGSGSRQMGRVKVRNFNFGNPFGGFYVAPVPVYVQGRPDRRRNDGKPGDALRLIVGFAAAILGGFAIFKCGQALSHLKSTNDEIAENKEFKRNLDSWSAVDITGSSAERIKSLRLIAKKRNDIFSRVRNNSIFTLTIAVAGVTTAIFALLGAVFASYGLMGIALLGGLAIGGVFLFKLGFGWNDKKNQQDALVIAGEIAKLKSGII